MTHQSLGLPSREERKRMAELVRDAPCPVRRGGLPHVRSEYGDAFHGLCRYCMAHLDIVDGVDYPWFPPFVYSY